MTDPTDSVKHEPASEPEAVKGGDDDRKGDWDGQRCPRCGGATLANKLGERWCSYVGGESAPPCTWGLDDYINRPPQAAAEVQPRSASPHSAPEGLNPECDDALTDDLHVIVGELMDQASIDDEAKVVSAILAAFRARGYWSAVRQHRPCPPPATSGSAT